MTFPRPTAAAVCLVAWAACACGGPQHDAGEHSHAADAMIEKAKTPEERAELEKVRDEVDAAAKKKIRELDAEIERLRKENEELRKGAR